jgi:predicted MFS family arabinose efflux permease
MGWLTRLGLVAGGLFVILLARAQLQAGHWVFDNAGYRQTSFAAAGYGVGALLILLAFLPPRAWIYKRITTKRSKLLRHNRRRRSPE